MPFFNVMVEATRTPLRTKTIAVPAAGALHGTPSRHTGDVGLLITVPLIPLGLAVAASAAPMRSAKSVTASGIA